MTETSCTPSPVPAATSPVAVASGALDGKSTAPIDDPTLKDSEEPQNPLTKKFTDAEWAALKEFRAQLPDIYAAAFPNKADARSAPITIWGIDVDPVNAHKDARLSVVLMKFLRARKLSVTKARDMFTCTLSWREAFNIPAVLEEKFPQEVFGNLKHIHGKNLSGRPVVYNVHGGNVDMKAVFGDLQRYIRWRVAFMERSLSKLDFIEVDQCLQVHDYEDLVARRKDAKITESQCHNLFTSHYPQLTYKNFVVNVTTLVKWILWVYKRVGFTDSLAKTSVVGTGQHVLKKALGAYIPLDQLPLKYRGNSLEPIRIGYGLK